MDKDADLEVDFDGLIFFFFLTASVFQNLSSLVVQLVKWLESLLWHGFDPWPENFHMPRVWPKQTNKQKNT